MDQRQKSGGNPLQMTASPSSLVEAAYRLISFGPGGQPCLLACGRARSSSITAQARPVTRSDWRRPAPRRRSRCWTLPSAVGDLRLKRGLVGGAAAAAARCEPVFRVFSRNVVHMGDAGAGQTAKLFNNALLMMNQANIELAPLVWTDFPSG